MSTKTTKRKRASAAATKAAAAVAEMKVAPAAELEAIALASNVEPEPVASIVSEPAPVAADPALVVPEASANVGPTIGLASNCTVKDAAALKNELLQLLDEPGSVALDAKSVERIDTAIIQLLCAFVRDRSQRNSGVTWVGAPQPLLDAARLLGVGALLSLPQEATP